ncbi:hypothetical protein BF93_09520 [Brachybacterium phenoliresistens]|uniref:Multidrug DMT transporter permease n=1 Tax=Brachybacterium phenoliresistens TaxID=396014 RepID=Z9JPU7_9MICO|nr:hypothetical protein [Brachybacterium phenoliresistens]EWS79821.1 hypothetical protein BF93_09520 [Brachybacterium phenoliresistens]
MSGATLGIAIALTSAIILAVGVELQSRAVTDRGAGSWRALLRSPRWVTGVSLLGTSVLLSISSLALAPVSIVQSMSVVSLIASTAIGVRAARIALTRRLIAAILACLVGVLGVITVIAAHPGSALPAQLDGQLHAVLVVQATVLGAGLLVMALDRLRRARAGRPARVGRGGWGGASRHGRRAAAARRPQLLPMAGLVAGATGFAGIAVVFKVLTGLVQRDGLLETITRPDALLALPLMGTGAAVSAVLVQRSHASLPPTAVVAGLTIAETLTAALVGTLVLQESSPTPGAALALVALGTLAAAGVIGIGRSGAAAAPAPAPAIGRSGSAAPPAPASRRATGAEGTPRAAEGTAGAVEGSWTRSVASGRPLVHAGRARTAA